MRRRWIFTAGILLVTTLAEAETLSLTCSERRGGRDYTTQLELNSAGGIVVDGVAQNYSNFVWNANVISFWTPLTSAYWRQWTINRITGVLNVIDQTPRFTPGGSHSQQCRKTDPGQRKF